MKTIYFLIIYLYLYLFKMSDNIQGEKQTVSLSSWTYGSFLPCNPGYNVKVVGNPKRNTMKPPTEKRILKEEEKIVTNDYLKNMADFKVMKGEVKRNKSSSHLYRKTNTMTNQSNQSNMNDNYATTKTMTKKNNFKYQLEYEEWLAVKQKQQMIYKEIQR